MDMSTPTTQQPNENTSLGLQLLKLMDGVKALIVSDDVELTKRETGYILKAQAYIAFALDIAPDGLIAPDDMAGRLNAGQYHYNAIDAEVMRKYEVPCVVCGSNHSYAGRRDEESWYSYQVCNGCGCGYSF